MKLRYFQIAGGNDTALVLGAGYKNSRSLSKKLLKKVEQVGFIDTKPYLALSMMGGELCINAGLAAAFMAGGKGRISLGATEADFNNMASSTKISLNLPYKQAKDTVIFENIGYKLTYGGKPADKAGMRNLCRRYNLPAFGMIELSGSEIKPLVYVRQTDSLVNETACGSGSVAVCILTGISKVIQPTGKIIKIKRQKGRFTISANVSEILI